MKIMFDYWFANIAALRSTDVENTLYCCMRCLSKVSAIARFWNLRDRGLKYLEESNELPSWPSLLETMFSKVDKPSWFKIKAAGGKSSAEWSGRKSAALLEACGENALPCRTNARCVKAEKLNLRSTGPF
ncbi:hypothetical protein TNCV_176011 [Trichonephila clavipes]|nr:hypothetical protein TNCV_176011 [Trichonephila clavipes]